MLNLSLINDTTKKYNNNKNYKKVRLYLTTLFSIYWVKFFVRLI